MEVREEGGNYYTYRYTVTTWMTQFCIKMGSDESHFNVSVGSDGQSQDSVHKPQPFWRERRAEAVSNRGPSAYQTNALPLGQTGSHSLYQPVTVPLPKGLRCPSGMEGSGLKTGGGNVASIDWSLTKPIFPWATANTTTMITKVVVLGCMFSVVSFTSETDWWSSIFFFFFF